MKKNVTIKKATASERLLQQVVAIESVINKLPELSILGKAQLEHDRAIENLYYSSKLEGSDLTQKRIKQAIYGKELSAT
jgi:hypothetical protein